VPLRSVSLDDLTIEDEKSFSHVAVYAELKRMLRKSGHRFLVPAGGTPVNWDRALFLNLTFWSAEEGADVLCAPSLPADVLAHIAWHHLAAGELSGETREAPCAAALFFGEAIASAFDLYLVGRLLLNVPDSDFVTTQVSIMSEAAETAGLLEADFAALLDAVTADPERAFEDLRQLLFDASRALSTCRDAQAAQEVLESFARHRFASLLHHYQLSNWILYARAYAGGAPAQEQRVRELDASLRAAPVALDWLTERWLGP
jgi:hypothetical protein